MMFFGNHMEIGTSNKHIGSECRNRLETKQRTKKIRHNGTKLQIHDMTRHKTTQGSHKVLTIFLQFCM